MNKLVTFTLGAVVGIAATPAIIVYVKPVQRGLIKASVSLYSFALKQEGSDFREKLVGIRDHIDQFLRENPEHKQSQRR